MAVTLINSFVSDAKTIIHDRDYRLRVIFSETPVLGSVNIP